MVVMMDRSLRLFTVRRLQNFGFEIAQWVSHFVLLMFSYKDLSAVNFETLLHPFSST